MMDLENWEPKRKEDLSEVGRWLVRGHEVALLQSVIHERKYPWREEASCTRWLAQCVTCGGNLYRWEEEKITATRDLEDHIEECEREKHNAIVINLARSHEVRL
jgi:hypothetical protein